LPAKLKEVPNRGLSFKKKETSVEPPPISIDNTGFLLKTSF